MMATSAQIKLIMRAPRGKALPQRVKLSRRDLVALKAGGCGVESAHVFGEGAGDLGRQF
jgi:hypothetical protein